MNCQTCEHKLPDYVIERLDAALAAEVREHLEDCDACSDYLQQVRFLYTVPEDFVSDPPAVLVIHDQAERGNGFSPTRRVAAMAVGLAAAAAVLVVGFRLGSRLGGDESFGDLELAKLTPIRLELPELPDSYEVGSWIGSQEEVDRLAAYTGLPVLEEYVLENCIRCKGMEEYLKPSFVPVLGDFILHRQYGLDLPSDVEAEAPPDEDPLNVFPVLRVVDGTCKSDLVWQVGEPAIVEEIVADYYSTCVLDAEDLREPLDAELFEWALENFRRLPLLVAEQRFGEAFEVIRNTRELEEMYRTRFAEDARRLESALVSALSERVTELEGLADASEFGRIQARELARDLRDQWNDESLADRIEALCR